jgi:hypothetical protein
MKRLALILQLSFTKFNDANKSDLVSMLI